MKGVVEVFVNVGSILFVCDFYIGVVDIFLLDVVFKM